MLRIKFRYCDELSNWEWCEQECVVSSISECKKLYGLGIDCEYQIISVEDLDAPKQNDFVYFVNSDENQNNYGDEFIDKERAIQFAKDHIEDKTFVVEVEYQGDEAIGEEIIWSYIDEE